MAGVIWLIRDGDSFRLVFPQAARHRLRQYETVHHKKYTVLEPTHTPEMVVEVGRETAQSILNSWQGRVDVDVVEPRWKWSACLFMESSGDDE